MGEFAKCPECKMRFEVEDDLFVGGYTYCPNCDSELKVVKLDPIKLEIDKKSAFNLDDHDDEDEDDDNDGFEDSYEDDLEDEDAEEDEDEDEDDGVNDW